jgi:Domain of unknown function (DUF4336)
VVPLYPYGQRRTLCQELVPDWIWSFDQVQGIFYVVVPIRMTVVRLAAGGLLVYAPVAPTPECVRQLRSLEACYGEVRYIILPTVSGIEHKVFVGPFARCFAQAQIYVAPNQWSFPLNLPLSWLGLPSNRTQLLPAESSQTPFGDEFDYAILGPIHLGPGPFVEVALFHRRSRSLLLTDSLVVVPAVPPAILQADPYPLLFHARDRATDPLQDTPAHRLKGWQRICLFGLYFRPAALAVADVKTTLSEARLAPDRSRRNFFGLYPFCWQPGWQQAFTALHGGGRLLVAPVLQTLIFSRGPQQVLDWVNQVSRWPFERVIPCHLEAPVAAGPPALKQAFEFLTAAAEPLPPADLQLLRQIETGLVRFKITPPAQALPLPAAPAPPLVQQNESE